MSTTDTDRFCVIRNGQKWFALPASTVREVMVCPDVTCVPNTSSVLIGIGHLRNEFLAITDPLSRSAEQRESTSNAQLIVVTAGDGPWGLLVDEVAQLTTLEDYQPKRNTVENIPIEGTAVYEGQQVEILDAEEMYRSVASELKTHWQGALQA